MKNEKIQYIIYTLIVLGILIYLIITKGIPTFKNTFGSSDSIINPNKYANLVDINVNDKISLGVILDKNKKVYHLFFYEDNSTIFYNQNIEDNNLDKGLDLIVSKLIEKDYLKENYNLKLTKYNIKYYNEFKKSLNKALNKYHVKVNIIEEDNTIEQLANSLELNYSDDTRALLEIDLLLKDSTSKDIKEEKKIDNKDIKKYSNNIYIKIEKYKDNNNIINEERDKTKLDITTIPGDNEGRIIPSSDSYYYIKDSKVYAYIKLTIDEKVYDYCYNGSIDEYKEGMC